MSDKTLHARLLAARIAMKDPKLDGTNPHFGSSFVTRDSALDSVLPALANEGLFMSQGVFDGELATTVWDEAGNHETLCRYPVAPNPDPQKYLASLTYASRGSMMLVFAIAGEPDDDGNTAAKPEPRDDRASAAKAATNTQPTEPTGFDAVMKALISKPTNAQYVKAALELDPDMKLSTKTGVTLGRKAFDAMDADKQAAVMSLATQ